MRKQKEQKAEKSSRRPVRVCANPGCGRPVDDASDRAERLCPDCAIGLELFDRGERRERIFAGAE
jgi:hypothetical protein